jgi:hypothetical protein
MLRRKLFNLLPAPNYRSSMVNGWQQVDDIVKAMLQQHKENQADAKKIAKYFCGSNERETARNIFNFLKTEIQYVVEPSSKQSVKSIPRFLADGKGDCKHFTTFANSILSACGYQPVYRFAGYGNKGIQHTYTFLPKSNTILDAVLPSFDTEKTPTIKKDYKMSLYKLSGIDELNAVQGFNFSKVKSALKSAQTKQSASVKKAVKSIPAVAKKVTQGMKTVSLAAPRTAFIGLVALNFRNLATDLKKIYDVKGRESTNWWYTLGGNRDTLIEAFTKASTKKRLMGIQEENQAFQEVFGGYSGDGVYVGEPVTIATAIATATPLLIQASKYIEANGKSVSALKDAINTGKKTFTAVTGKQIEDVIFKKDAGANTTSMKVTADDLQPVSYDTATKVAETGVALATGTDLVTIQEMQGAVVTDPRFATPGTTIETPFGGLSQKTLLIGGAVVVVGFLLLRKKGR